MAEENILPKTYLVLEAYLSAGLYRPTFPKVTPPAGDQASEMPLHLCSVLSTALLGFFPLPNSGAGTSDIQHQSPPGLGPCQQQRTIQSAF